jgi:hypothetical protein
MTAPADRRHRAPRSQGPPASRLERALLAGGLVASVIAGVVIYQVGGPYGERLYDEPGAGRLYDPDTGLLRLLATDRDSNLWFDMWTHYADGALVRSELDDNEDGVIDYWRHYAADGSTLKVGFSTKRDGVEDAWVHVDDTGILERIEYSTSRDGVVDRTEYYEAGVVVRVE